jgi:hypothetical protein
LAGIGVLVLAGAVVLFWPGGSESLGRLEGGAAGGRVLNYVSGSWSPAGRVTLRSGDRVETLQAGATPCTLRFGAWGEAVLQAPCVVQIDRVGATLTLQLLQQAPGRIELRTQAASAAGARYLRVAWGSAWVEANAGEGNEVSVEPLSGEGGGWTGQLRASVKGGAARLGNTGDPQTVGEGFSRVVPQTGKCDAAEEFD